MPDHVGEDVRNLLPVMGAEDQADTLDEEEFAIAMELAEVIERGRKDRLPALRNMPKKKLLEETAMVTNRLGVKIDKVAGRKEPVWKRRLQNKIKELRKDLSQLEASKDKDISNFRHYKIVILNYRKKIWH